MLTQAGLVAHAVACFAFAALGFWLARRPGEGAPSRWLIGACVATALWAFTYVVVATTGRFGALLSPAETVRTAVWIVFVVALLQRSWALDQRPGSSFTVAVALGFTVALQLALDTMAGIGAIGVDDPQSGTIAYVFLFTRLTIAIGGLVLTHNLYVNTAPSSRWSVQMLCIGLAGLFGYDLNLYTFQLLTGGLVADLYNIRGAAAAFIVPMIALSARRSKGWQLKVSRQVAFQTFSLAGIGGYLVLMSLLGYGLKLVGGDWGRLLQISFIFATVLLAATVLVSGRFRAWARVTITKHFFAYRYDYRVEWLRFLTTLSRTGEAADGTLRQRVAQAVCAIVDSPGGALFIPDEEGRFVLDTRWNSALPDAVVEAGDPLLAYLAERGRIVDVVELRDGRGDYAFAAPEWADGHAAWLLVPLVHLDQLTGFIAIARSLAPRGLNWEDFDLLRTVGRQSASYIAESSSQSALSEAKKFDEFNRRFAFIMHDIKNVASQLGLVARNAERHAENPEFRADMIATLQGSVARMKDLLARLGERGGGDRGAGVSQVALGPLLAAVVRAKRPAHGALELGQPAEPLVVEADAGRLEQALEHLVQNAIDASEAGRPIRVLLAREGEAAKIDIIDEGVGMSAAFVRDELYKPFHSTKSGGFGIGAYEAREIVRAARGRLSVASRAGEGSVFTITLPLVAAAGERRAA